MVALLRELHLDSIHQAATLLTSSEKSGIPKETQRLTCFSESGLVGGTHSVVFVSAGDMWYDWDCWSALDLV